MFLHSDMTVLMRLQGGPLDGEIQIVEMLPTTPRAQLFFNIPNYQTFEPNTETVIGVGLQAYYALVGPGAGPGVGDSWTTSWIFDFTGEAYVPAPPPLYPPGQGPPIPPPTMAVFMVATTTLVSDTLPIVMSPSVMMSAGTAIDVEAQVQPFQYGVVAMTGETVLSTQADWQPKVVMGATAGITVDPNAAAMSGTAGLTVAGTSASAPAAGLYAYGYLSSGHFIYYSTDGGNTWTALSTPLDFPGSGPHLGVTQMVNTGHLLVGAVAGSSNGGFTILVSADGVNWAAYGTALPYGSGIAYNGSLLVMGGWSVSGGPAIVTSTDGVTWIARRSPFDGGHVRQVAWNGTQWMATGQSATGPPYTLVATSPDGITWTGHATPLDSAVFSGAHCEGLALLWNPYLGRWAVGFQPDTNGYGVVGLSPDGTTWTTQEIPGFLPNWVPFYNSVTHQMIFSGQDNVGANNVIYTSSDGVAWTANAIANAGAATNVSFGESFFWTGVAFGRGGSPNALQKGSTPSAWVGVPTPFDGYEPAYGVVVV